MATDNITKILVRRGTDGQRKYTNTTGITFDLGEPAFTVDTKRLYIGDGKTSGGISTGMRNLGTIPFLFDNNSITNEAANLFALSGIEVGDIIYETSSKSLYTLSSFSFSEPVKSDFAKYEFVIDVNPMQLEYNPEGELQIRLGGVGVFEVNSAMCEPGGGLAKPYISSGISITNDGVINAMLNKVPANTVKGNPSTRVENPTDIELGPGQILGRTFNKPLSGINYETLIKEVFATGLRPVNGVAITNLAGSQLTLLGLSASHFDIYQHEIHLLKPTRIDNGDFVVLNGDFGVNSGNIFIGGDYQSTGSISINGGVRCGTIESNIIVNDNSIKTSTLNAETADINAIHVGDLQATSIDNAQNIHTNTLTSTIKVETAHVQTRTFESNSVSCLGNLTNGGNILNSGNIINSGNLNNAGTITAPTANVSTGNITTMRSVDIENSGNMINTGSLANGGTIACQSLTSRAGIINTGGFSNTGDMNNTGNIIAGGYISCTGVIQSTGNDIVAYSTSDVTLKKNIKKIESPLNKISQISGYNFEWNSDEDKYNHLQGEDIGVLANEIEAVIPHAVITRPDGVKAVNYIKIIPLLIESIKTLQAEVSELKNELR